MGSPAADSLAEDSPAVGHSSLGFRPGVDSRLAEVVVGSLAGRRRMVVVVRICPTF